MMRAVLVCVMLAMLSRRYAEAAARAKQVEWSAKKSPTARSKIEIDNHLSTNSLRELRYLNKDLLAFGVLRNSCLRFFIGCLVGILHNDKPVSDIRAGLKAA
jgi:hypothetical protein